MNKLETIYNLQLKITVPEKTSVSPTLTIKLGVGSMMIVYYNKLQDLPPELKTIVNACVSHDIITLKEIENLISNILPNNT